MLPLFTVEPSFLLEGIITSDPSLEVVIVFEEIGCCYDGLLADLKTGLEKGIKSTL
jgi:hypothetical protein